MLDILRSLIDRPKPREGLSRRLRGMREDINLVAFGGALTILLLVVDGVPVRRALSGLVNIPSSCPKPSALIQYRASVLGENPYPPIMDIVCPPSR